MGAGNKTGLFQGQIVAMLVILASHSVHVSGKSIKFSATNSSGVHYTSAGEVTPSLFDLSLVYEADLSQLIHSLIYAKATISKFLPKLKPIMNGGILIMSVSKRKIHFSRGTKRCRDDEGGNCYIR